MTRKEFFELADSVADRDCSADQCRRFEAAIESNPEWMELWIDEQTALRQILGLESIEPSESFTASLQARWRAQQIRLSINHWTPAGLAAIAAAIGLFALLQYLSEPAKAELFGRPEAEARLEPTTQVPLPTLEEPLTR